MNLSLVPIFSPMNSAYTLPSYCFKIHFITIVPSMTRSYRWCLSFGFSYQNVIWISLFSCLSEWGSRDNVVNIATGYRLDDRGVGVWVSVRSRIFSSPRHPDRLWGPHFLLSNEYWGLFPWGKSGWGVKMTTHQLVPRSRKCGSIHPFPIRPHMPSWHGA
jgi:hypothetical protein